MEKSPESHIQTARKALQVADYKIAVIELKSALQGDSNNLEARLLLGQTLQAQEQWADSEKYLRKAMEIGASPEEILPWLAHTLIKQGKFEEAIKLEVPNAGLGSQALVSLQAERAIAQMSLNRLAEAATLINEGEKALASTGTTDISPSLQLAKAYLAFSNKQPAEALAQLETALKKDAKFVDALRLKAEILFMDGGDAEAIKVYRQIIAVKPGDTLALLAIAEASMRAADLKSADEAIATAEKNGTNNVLVNYARARIEYGKGNMKRANEALQQVMRATSDPGPAISLLHASVNYELGNYEQSRKSASLVLSQQPDNIHAAKLVAVNQLRQGDTKSALGIVLPMLKTHPNDARLLSLAGEVYLQSKQYSKAMEFLDKAARLQPKDAEIKQHQARGHLALGRTDQATADLEQAVSLSDKSGQADLSLITLHLRQKQYDQALQAIAALEKKLPNNPVTHNLRAAAYMGKDDKAAARKSWQQALSIQPDFYPAAANLARLDMAEKNPAAARKRFESILEKGDKNVQAMMALAAMAASEKNDQDSLNWLEKAAKADPQAIPPRAALVRYYLEKKNPQKALNLAREAADANPESPEALVLLGAAQIEVGDKSSGISTLTKVTEKAPASAEAFHKLALAQLASQQNAAARISLEKALSLRPGHIAAFDLLTRMDLAEKKPEQALQRARKFQVEDPKSAFGFDREAGILLSQKQFAQAAKQYEQAINRGAGGQGLINLHNALLLAGNHAGAEQKLADWLKRHPKDKLTQAYAANHYARAGRQSEAIAQYQALLATTPNNALLLNNLANLYFQTKDVRALETAEKAYKLNPAHPAIQDTLGWILVQRGDAKRGVEVLSKALTVAPKSPAIRYHYAVALAQTGNKTQAKQELEQVIGAKQTFPEQEEARLFLKGL
jgi:putative PEP-CTERM system TPR-repeat lipoprotein